MNSDESLVEIFDAFNGLALINRGTAFIETNGDELHVIKAGPEGGQPVLLLHGFPEFWY